jgi:hypothetical protein
MPSRGTYLGLVRRQRLEQHPRHHGQGLGAPLHGCSVCGLVVWGGEEEEEGGGEDGRGEKVRRSESSKRKICQALRGTPWPGAIPNKGTEVSGGGGEGLEKRALACILLSSKQSKQRKQEPLAEKQGSNDGRAIVLDSHTHTSPTHTTQPQVRRAAPGRGRGDQGAVVWPSVVRICFRGGQQDLTSLCPPSSSHVFFHNTHCPLALTNQYTVTDL